MRLISVPGSTNSFRRRKNWFHWPGQILWVLYHQVNDWFARDGGETVVEWAYRAVGARYGATAGSPRPGGDSISFGKAVIEEQSFHWHLSCG